MMWLEQQLRTGSTQDQAYADIIGGVLAARGEDIPLPEGTDTGDTAAVRAVEPAQVGHLVLRTTANSLIVRPVQAETAANDNLEAFKAHIDRVTHPYAELFLGEVPLARDNEKNRRGHVKHVDDTRTRSWHSTEVQDDMSVGFSYSLTYRLGEEHNTLTTVSLDITSQHDIEEHIRDHGDSTPKHPILLLTFEDGDIQNIMLKWNQLTPHTILKLAKDNVLGSFLNEFYALGNDIHGSSLRIDMSGDTPSVSLSQHVGRLPETWHVGHVSSTFRYLKDRDELAHHINDVEAFQKLVRESASSDRDVMTNEEFLQLTSDLLALIPTIAV